MAQRRRRIWRSLVASAEVNTAHRSIAAALKSGSKRAIWLGALALRHPAYADLRAVAAGTRGRHRAHAGRAGRRRQCRGRLSRGRVPHRDAGRHRVRARPGMNARDMLSAPLEAYLLFGGIEPWADATGRGSTAHPGRRAFVVAATPFADENAEVGGARAAAHRHLRRDLGHLRESRRPVAELCRRGAAAGRSAPGWKVLRVLGNLAQVSGFRVPVLGRSARRAARALRGHRGRFLPGNAPAGAVEECRRGRAARVRCADVRGGRRVRRAPSLQRTREGSSAAVVYGSSGA